MLQFETLTLSGFKSFVDKTTLNIDPGLNGIVGPNGCGKSNLVEALRWAMGESSAKRMRGDGMEDVIFNGSNQRSARNIADVVLSLNNKERTAPPAFNAHDTIEVSRKIERDRGSNYRINGKNVRARDVQMLFADTVTGSNSPALVSQGQIARIISAKPVDRRIILEESAGISGLYARRHEAELRLKAANTNLTRLADILSGVETQLNGLKRQAKAAAKYKTLNATIRELDIIITYIAYIQVSEAIQSQSKKVQDIEDSVKDKMLSVTQLSKTQNTLHEDLPALRKAEIEVATKLQRLKIELQNIENSEKQAQKERDQINNSVTQTQTDLDHEKQLLNESRAQLEQRNKEYDIIIKDQSDRDEKLALFEQSVNETKQHADNAESAYNAAMQSHAEQNASRDSALRSVEKSKQRYETVCSRHKNAADRIKEIKALNYQQDTDSAYASLQSAKKVISELESKKSELDKRFSNLSDTITTKRNEHNVVKENLTRIETEIDMLDSFLAQTENDSTMPMRDKVTPQSGFEKAISRALGDALLAGLDQSDTAYWVARTTPKLPPLPDQSESLKLYVDAPDILKPALSQIGVVKTKDDLNDVAKYLSIGQSLVTQDGQYMRWDGYCITADAHDRNADILEHRNTRDALKKSLLKTERDYQKLDQTLHVLVEKEKTYNDDISRINDEIAQTRQTISQCEITLVKAQEATTRQETELKNAQSALADIETDMAALEQQIKDDESHLATLKTLDNDENALNDLRTKRQNTQTLYQEAMRSYDQLHQTVQTQAARLQAVRDERVSLKNRFIRSEERVQDLTARLQDLLDKQSQLNAQKPTAKNTSKKDELHNAIAALEKQRNDEAEKLAERENNISQTMRDLRQAEEALSNVKEARGMAVSALESLQKQREAIHLSSVEFFDIEPSLLQAHITRTIDYDTACIETLKAEKVKATTERERIGAVNLRAEEEIEKLESETGVMIKERDDLMLAIEELRDGINKINGEARTRLLTAFETVNAHFQTLFKRLFGGGEAHLELVKTDGNERDPLISGLEIYAQPPGKSLQSLSLLSGGEQTLASIALIFGMFLTNPSPICVLDEIDAPLDDANVERVCDMLDHIVKNGKTRFLIVTHHRLTMARMDRLYGVTMSEKGVSQLVSVDLQQSFGFLETA